MRVIVAARLSRITQGQTGIDTQDGDAREWAEVHGHKVVATVADRKSGNVAPWDRPNLKPWVTRPDYLALYDGIVAAKQDRLSRADLSDEARIRLWAEENKKKLFIVDRNLQWPPRDADDREQWNNGAEQARREWEHTSKRYRRMQRALRDQGYFVGKRAYGYKIVGSGNHKALEIDEIQASVVSMMARRYLAGESLRDIRAWLNSERIAVPQPNKDINGRPVEGKWSAQAVSRVLSNPVITGRVMVKGRTYSRTDAIIEPADFDEIQKMMARKATREAVAKQAATLTSVLECEDGHPMYRLKGRPVASCPDGLYYYCNPDMAEKGQRHLISMTEADQKINGVILYTYGDLPNVGQRITPADKRANELAKVKAEMRELDPEADDYLERATALRAELERIRSCPSKPAAINWVPDGQSIREVWESLHTTGRRAWLIEHGWRVISTRKPKAKGRGYVYDLDFSHIDPASGLGSMQTSTRPPDAY